MLDEHTSPLVVCVCVQPLRPCLAFLQRLLHCAYPALAGWLLAAGHDVIPRSSLGKTAEQGPHGFLI